MCCGITLKDLPYVDLDALRSLKSKTIVHTNICIGMFVQLDADARTPSREEITNLRRRQVSFERFDVRKYNPTDQPVAADGKPVFGFQVFHIRAPEPALDITPSGIEHIVPTRAGKQQIWGFAPYAQPVELPKRQRIPAIVAQLEILTYIDLHHCPVALTSQSGEAGMIRHAALPTLHGIRRVVPRIIKRPRYRSAARFCWRKPILLKARHHARRRVYFPDVEEIIVVITQPQVQVGCDIPQNRRMQLNIVEVDRVAIRILGMSPKPKRRRRIFHIPPVRNNIIFIMTQPDVGIALSNDLIVLGIGHTRKDVGDFTGRVRTTEVHPVAEHGCNPCDLGITYRRKWRVVEPPFDAWLCFTIEDGVGEIMQIPLPG